MSSAIKILPYYTYDDWVQWEGKWELIDGLPYAMSPSPVPKHQRVGGNLFTEFRVGLRSCKNNCRVHQPIDYKITDDTILEPDMLVVCGQIQKKYLDFTPSLVAEILSPSTALKDRHTKFEIYQSQGVPYYLIISCEDESVEIYKLVNDEYQLQSKGREVEYTFQFDGCDVTINFAEIWD